MCIPSDSDRVNFLADAINTMAVDWSIFTPTVLATLQPADVPGLRTIIVAGEPLRKSQINLWAESTHLFQGYGFTEWAGICCVSHESEPPATLG